MSVTLPESKLIEYVVDGRNRRIGKKVNGTLVQGFLYESQLRPAAELDGAGNVVSRFIYGTKINVPEYMIKNGIKYRIVTDYLGSVRMVVNTSTGEVVQRMDYDEFGRVLFDSNPGFQPFGYAGGLYDFETGLVRFGARDYDAESGRWLSKDPIGFNGGDGNLFRYVNNNPICYFDPTGRFSSVGVAGTLILGAGAVTGNVPVMVAGGVLLMIDVVTSFTGAEKMGKEVAEKWKDLKKEQIGEEMFEEIYGSEKKDTSSNGCDTTK